MSVNDPPGWKDLRWTRLDVELENHRNAFAAEHPLSVLNAVWMYATRPEILGERPRYAWHPLQPVGRRIRKGRSYPLSICFPGDRLELAAQVKESLCRHLSDPRFNFHVRSAGEPTLRCPGDLLPPPDTLGTELCLLFETPMPFNPGPGKGRRWDLRPDRFLEILRRRIAQWFGEDATRVFPEPDLSLLTGFWNYVEYRHTSRSQRRGGCQQQYFNGCQGPLYLRGNVGRLWPTLALCSEIQLCTRLHSPLGFFRLLPVHPCLDSRLGGADALRELYHRLNEESDLSEDLRERHPDVEVLTSDLSARIRGGAWEPQPATAFSVPKRHGGTRTISMLQPSDRIVHRHLLDLLAPPLDRTLSEACTGFRKGRSIVDVRHRIAAAVREGYGWVFETDIEEFFDQIDWQVLERTLRERLPRADVKTLRMVLRAVRTPLSRKEGAVPRHRGVLQGSPLSPLLANVVLDGFDRALAAPERRVLRYGDDVLVLCRSREDAEQAMETAAEQVEQLGMRLKAEKTRVSALNEGVGFLGFDLGPSLEEETVHRSRLRRTLYIREQFALVGVDGGSLVVKEKGKLVDRIPLHRIGELVMLGGNVISTSLVQRCLKERIPVTFCSPTGYYLNTIHPDSRQGYAAAARHHRRYDQLGEEGVLTIARHLVSHKIHNALWVVKGWPEGGDRTLRHRLESARRQAEEADHLDRLRGVEGLAARQMFQAMRQQLHEPEYRSGVRKPHLAPDRLNSVLDFSYYLLFVRLNVLVRTRGLNPYLGFLHSPENRYPSLICDLQEVFRPRIDRFVVKSLNRHIVRPEDFVEKRKGRWRLSGPATARYVEAFERELEIRLTGDPGTLRELLEAQVLSLEEWAVEQRDLHLYLSGVCSERRKC